MEILFRGKIKNWKEQPKEQWWAEGYYCKRKSGRYTDIGFEEEYKDCIVKEFSDGGISFCDVDPETVCQYTGLTDKNGRKIFEGDIVNVSFKEARIGAKEEIYPYAVEFCRSTSSFELVGNDELLGRPCFEVGNQFIMEVIGNIFDNPDLLKGAQDD